MTQWVEIIFDGHSLYLFVNKTYAAKLSIQEMPKLGVREHEIVKINKKGDFRKILHPFCDFTLKSVPRIHDPCIS